MSQVAHFELVTGCDTFLGIGRGGRRDDHFVAPGCRLENSTNSVVHTGVKSAGCENSVTHLRFEVKSVSFNIPCVVLASKSGANH